MIYHYYIELFDMFLIIIISPPFLGEVRFRFSFLYPVRQVLDIDPRWASALCRPPAPRWQRTEAVPSVVPLCYDAEWMALQKAPETGMLWEKGVGKWEILKL